MYLIREVFKCKPGKAKDIVRIFKEAGPSMEKDGFKNGKVMTDVATTYWTVVVQYEVEKMETFFANLRTETTDPKLKEIFKGYLDYLEGGRREIYLIE